MEKQQCLHLLQGPVQWLIASRDPLRENVSQADGQLLWWLYTHWCLFPSLPHLSGGCGFEPRDRQKFFCLKFNCLLEGMISMLKLTFLSYFFPIQLVWWYIDPSFLHFLLPLDTLRKLYVVPTLLLRNFPIFLFYPILTRPRLGNSQLERALWVIKFQQPLFATTLSALPSSYFNLSVCWVGGSKQGDQ